jgi:DNA-binding NarL/FixJ family response regulator
VTRLVLVEDHQLVREGLRLLLEQEPEFEIAGEASSPEQALEQALAQRPDVILLDIALADDDAVPLIGLLRARAPASRILVLSMYADAETVRQALLAGAAGYLIKGASAADLVAAIHAVARGETFLHSAIAGVVLNDGLRWLRSGARLSPREREVVSLLGDGRTPGRIAETLGISVHTVRRHLANAADKVQVHGIVALRSYAVTHGFARHLAHSSARSDETPVAH